MRRLSCSLGLAVLAVTFVPAPARAQQAISFYLGAFAPRAEDSRTGDDVLVQDRAFLDFDINRFNSGTAGVEWLVNLGPKTEAGLGVGFYQHTEPAFDRFSVFDKTGALIEADLKLRTIPFDATLRYLPMGHGGPVEPYFGAGITAIAWHYSETGDFVSTDGVTIVHGAFKGSGGAVGPVVLGGLRCPIGAAASLGGEVRYQSAKGDLPASGNFAGSKIDRGGCTYLLTFILTV
jgi:hypothetical protein